MKRKYIFLVCLLAASGIVVGLTGTVLKYAVLEPLGLHRQESAVAVPFVFLRDEGLQYVVQDLRETVPADVTATQSTETVPTEWDNAQLTRPERALFIGDSRTCGLRDHARMDEADYFCDVGMSVFNAQNKQLSDVDFKFESLYSLLSDREYGYVFISLGLNEAGYPIDSLLRAYSELLDRVVQTQPQAVIVLQGVMGVTRDWAQRAPHTAPENLRLINDGIQDLARRYRVSYVDANEEFADEEGYLPEDMTADGCHLYAKFSRQWAQWLLEEVEHL